MKLRTLTAVVFFFIFAAGAAYAVPGETACGSGTLLETGLGMRHLYYENGRGRGAAAWQTDVFVGLGWTPAVWFSVRGHVGVIWGVSLGNTFEYERYNKMSGTRHIGGFGIGAAVEFHLPSRIAGIEAAVDGRAFFMPSRSGLFEFTGGAGILLRPFHGSSGVLQQALFGIYVLFPIYSDLEAVFDIRYRTAAVGLKAGFGF